MVLNKRTQDVFCGAELPMSDLPDPSFRLLLAIVNQVLDHVVKGKNLVTTD